MKIIQAQSKLKRVKDFEDFQNLFFEEIDGEHYPSFEIVYKKGDNYTSNNDAKEYDRNGSCTNSFMKLEDGYIPYPF